MLKLRRSRVAPRARNSGGEEPLLTPTFATILGSNFLSRAAFALLNLALANRLYVLTGSATWAACVLVVAFLPQMLVGPRLGAFLDRSLRLRTLLACEGLACLIAVAAGVLLIAGGSLVLLLVVLALRSVVNAAVRTALTKWLKLTTPDELQARRMQLLQVSVLLALTLSGVAVGVASSLGGAEFIPWVLGINVGLYLASLAVLHRLRRYSIPVGLSHSAGEGATRSGWWTTFAEILRQRVLARHFAIACLAPVVFQSAEVVIVSVRGPMLGSDRVGVALLQVFASVGLMGGLLVLWCCPGLLSDRLPPIACAAAVGLCGLVLASWGDGLGWILPAFLVMVAAYELLEVNSSSRFFQASPPAHTARYSLAMTTLSGTGMGVAVLSFGLLIDGLGFAVAAVVFVGLCGVLPVVGFVCVHSLLSGDQR